MKTTIYNGQTTEHPSRKWDSYFHSICQALASNSPCLSRQIGAVLVRDKSIISTGYNGPPRNHPHCDGPECPRRVRGSLSSQDLISCPSVHAEANCIANAARIGASTIDSTLYMNSIIPCKDCASLLVNAGIIEVVVTEIKYYTKMSKVIFYKGNILIRTFNLGD